MKECATHVGGFSVEWSETDARLAQRMSGTRHIRRTAVSVSRQRVKSVAGSNALESV